VQPRIVAAQAAERTVTLASAIRIGEPAHEDEVDDLVANGGTEIVTVSDDEIRSTWLEIASLEGMFCEPSSAAGVAALTHLDLDPGTTVVCVLTGHGLKDTEAVETLTALPILVEPNLESILAGVSA